ncbi:ADP-ribosyltransferase-containing protein [Geopseudomonas aromaticivorans]
MKRREKVLYHGTAFDFERFDEGMLGRSVNNPTTGFGFFFSASVVDALSWAEKSARRFIGQRDPRVVEAKLGLQKLMELDYSAFHYYLQRARPSTIIERRQEWMAQGYDGLTVVREGVRWYAAFNPEAIEVVRVLQGAQLDRAVDAEKQASKAAAMVVEAFHGTCLNFDSFEPSERGSFGSGIYLADEAAARCYADNGDGAMVLRVQVTFRNPYHCQATYDHGVDLESPAVDLIRSLFPEGDANRLIAQAMNGDGTFGAEFQSVLQGMGHDGLIATYEDGSQEIVAFDPGQVVILERRMLESECELGCPAP